MFKDYLTTIFYFEIQGIPMFIYIFGFSFIYWLLDIIIEIIIKEKK
tara:strand:- start:147 stop:284 length:138 start_codon:yes stop_codon:yes gene_type:complete